MFLNFFGTAEAKNFGWSVLMAFLAMLNQVFILFLLIGVGVAVYKIRILDENGVKQVTTLLCYVVGPFLIIYAFQTHYSSRLMTGFLICAASTFVFHLVYIIIFDLIFNKKTVKDKDTRNELVFASIYENSGFMGFPLLQAVAGTTGLFYGAAYNGVFNLFGWSHGLMLYSDAAGKKSIIKIITNPNIIAVFIGFVLFRFSVTLPGPLYMMFKYISGINTPLSMIVIGASVAHVPFRKLFTEKLSWLVVLLKNLAVPLSLLVVLHALGVRGQLLLCCVLPAACPVAGIAVLFAKLNGKNSDLPSKFVTVSTLMCLVTIPAVVLAINFIQ